MGEVLVVVDHVDGSVRRPTLELLTIASRFGDPVAVFLGQGYGTSAGEVLAAYGATKIYVVGDVAIDTGLAPIPVSVRTSLATAKACWKSLPSSGPMATWSTAAR
jgi:electron transfer flavoprotein alpha subunit